MPKPKALFHVAGERPGSRARFHLNSQMMEVTDGDPPKEQPPLGDAAPCRCRSQEAGRCRCTAGSARHHTFRSADPVPPAMSLETLKEADGD